MGLQDLPASAARYMDAIGGGVLGVFYAAYYVHRNSPLGSVDAGHSVVLWVPKTM